MIERIQNEGEYFDILMNSRWQTKVHEHGLVALVDVMPRLVPKGQTCDYAIVQAARVSYGDGTKTISDDTGLIRYLMRHRHTSPFEQVEVKLHCAMPIFIARQWVRHRTACLSGDTLLQFDLPGGIERRGNQLTKLSVREIYERFQPTINSRPDKQGNPFHKRDRIKNCLLRSLNESTGEVRHTHIVDIWETGSKSVWEVRYKDQSVKASEDHLFFTSQGWRKLKEIATLTESRNCQIHKDIRLAWIGPGIGTGVIPNFNTINPETESWMLVPDWEDYYAVSDQGRVKRIVGGQGAGSFGRCKTLTVSNGRAVVSLNRPGYQETRQVHQLVMLAFRGPCPEGLMICHDDGNSLNNDLDNLYYGTPTSNADDRVRDAATTQLSQRWITPVIDYVGVEQTYDIEVLGPWHNFSADGFVVHNSVNEVSGRYSIIKDRFYRPPLDGVREQSNKNKQGGDNTVGEVTALDFLDWLKKTEEQYGEYERFTELGVSRELARIGLPASVYTEWYWKIDLHNLFHFLSLRMDKHAQQEIQDYANPIFEMVREICPIAAQAFLDYKVNALTLSGPEVEAINDRLLVASENKREQGEFEAKLKRLRL